MEEPVDKKATPGDGLSRRTFLQHTGVGFSLMLGGMRVLAESKSAEIQSEDSGAPAESNSPIKVHPANPHYYMFRGRPTILITSAEHYGPVINMDFDYVSYLDKLADYGLNYTRVWPGGCIEVVGEFYSGNTVGPRPSRTIVPWARSTVPSCVYCGNKYDLDKWNPQFFTRLKDFIVQAGDRGIVVEVNFFNSQYSHRWPLHPMYYENNIQGVGKCDFKDVQTLKHPDLVERQSKYVSKIVEEVNGYDNIILEICDEPSNFTPHAEAGPWVGHLLEVVHDTEARLPQKHLVAQMVEGPIGGPVDFSASPFCRSLPVSTCGAGKRIASRWEE